MKNYDRIFVLVVAVFLVLVAGTNIILNKLNASQENKAYRIDINRAIRDIEKFESLINRAPDSLKELKLVGEGDTYDYILGIESVAMRDGEERENVKISEEAHFVNSLKESLYGEEAEYYLFFSQGYCYKITYDDSLGKENRIGVLINVVFAALLAGIIAVYIYIRNAILAPFNRISNLPYEISKGNVSKPIPESKSKYFGKYIWGMNMLRESLLESKDRELSLQRDKKVLLLSLAHDIKTPLNAISLYAKAISKNLYRDLQKNKEVAENISEKVNEIEGYMGEIVKATNEDFLVFQVNNTEVYIKDVLSCIDGYYRDKMSINMIDFHIDNYSNSLLVGDKERLIEVIQNIIENAIKYGDGRKILLSACKDLEEYVIIIKNSGCTLPQSELSHIFDSFYRGSNVADKQGSGLGLYICRQLVHLMEGEITAGIVREDGESMMELRIILRLA